MRSIRNPMLLPLIALALFAAIAPPAEAVPKAPKGFLGVAPQAELRPKDTARMKRGKVKKMRVAIHWETVQPKSAADFDWRGFDHIMRVTARKRIRVMPTLYASPPWLNPSYTDLPVKNSNQLRHWRKFVGAVADRYGRKGYFWSDPDLPGSHMRKMAITQYQLWNEPNFHYFAMPVKPGQYARLVNAGSAAIRKKDSKAEIVLSGLFARPKGPPNRARYANKYLKQFSRKVKKKKFDSIAIHPYAKNTRRLRQTMKSFRRAAVKSGLKRKKIYVTEIGWGSGKKTNAFLAGSPRKQAKKLTSAFKYLVNNRRGLNLKGVYWFAWEDLNPKKVESCSFCYTIGLFKADRSKLKPKPAWRKFVKFTRGRP